MRRRFVNSLFAVTFFNLTRTTVRLTVTVAETRSPGRTLIRRLTGGAGKSSNQATQIGRPSSQFACVPVCSTANALREKPPRPTQKAEYVSPLLHVAAGLTQRPVT